MADLFSFKGSGLSLFNAMPETSTYLSTQPTPVCTVFATGSLEPHIYRKTYIYMYRERDTYIYICTYVCTYVYITLVVRKGPPVMILLMPPKQPGVQAPAEKEADPALAGHAATGRLHRHILGDSYGVPLLGSGQYCYMVWYSEVYGMVTYNIV